MRSIRSCFVLALLALPAFGPASAQIVCEKNGKFKLRDECRANKGETVAVDLSSIPTQNPVFPFQHVGMLGFNSNRVDILELTAARAALRIDDANQSIQFTT